ncbi:MAG TPA: nuclear transport factor 2 family protein [Solirubrobacteraceae bacterium]|nr:nuclear transport factor 2 family protein [Solirubrobacteraceae bacterium]
MSGDMGEADGATVAAAAIEAWNREDLPAFLATLAERAEWRPAFPKGTEGTGGVFGGHAEIEQAWHSVRDAWSEYQVSAEEVRLVGEELLVLGRIYARGRSSGLEIRSEWSAVVEVRDGQIVKAWDWLAHAPALDAVGLAP